MPQAKVSPLPKEELDVKDIHYNPVTKKRWTYTDLYSPDPQERVLRLTITTETLCIMSLALNIKELARHRGS